MSYRPQNLADLVWFRHTLGVLNVHPRVALPRHFIPSVTGHRLSRFTKKVMADFTQLIETNTPRVSLHFDEGVFNARHFSLYSIINNTFFKSAEFYNRL